MMIRTLQKHGNSVALLFDKTMLDAMNMTQDTPVQVTIANGSITISPANVGVDRDELKAHIARLRPKYKRMLENLAK
jgi:antitoxin component of MazEF toxin-antitoxin module